MKNKKIIFVCHYFPPETNVGIRRVLFWANHFSNIGYKVEIITTKKKNSESMYQVLNKDVKVFEYSCTSLSVVGNGNVGEVITSRNSNKNSLVKRFFVNIKRKIINPIFGQIIDHRLIGVFCFIFSLKLGRYKKIINRENFKGAVVISTSPPWPMHILGEFLARKYEAKFYADYRDPFSNNHIFSSRFNWLEEKIERFILKHASGVFTVSDSWVKYYNKFHENVFLLRNGYDSNMFESSENKVISDNLGLKKELVLNYFGSIEHEERVPKLLLEFLIKTKLNVKVNFYGSCSLLSEYLKTIPNSKIELMGMLSYIDTIDKMKESDINVVCESMNGVSASHQGLIPTKVYEYLAARRPILAVVCGNSDMYPILSKSGLLLNEPIDSIEDIENCINELSNKVWYPNEVYINSLSRQVTAEKLEKIIQRK